MDTTIINNETIQFSSAIADIFIKILGTIITIIVTALTYKLLDWIGIKRNAELDKQLNEKIGEGIMYAEQMAKNALKDNQAKFTGSAKKDMAIAYIQNEVENHPQLKKLLNNVDIQNRIESVISNFSDVLDKNKSIMTINGDGQQLLNEGK